MFTLILVLILLGFAGYLLYLMAVPIEATPNISADRKAALVAAYSELDRLEGKLIPEFIEVPDGHYTHRLVIDHLPRARSYGRNYKFELPDYDPNWYHEERSEKPIPKCRTELVWKKANG